MEYGRTVADAYKHYKYYHFYSICFGLGWAAALYRPYRSLTVPVVLAVFFTILLEVLGVISDLPAHTRRCKGRPYDIRDVCWGFGFALFVAILNLRSYHVYTMSYGCGIIVFALRGAKRKYSSLWELRDRQHPW
ncbi:uncharacterized protein AB9X84_010530 isoform 1-T1 [Acanthopagrus schlegelii]